MRVKTTPGRGLTGEPAFLLLTHTAVLIRQAVPDTDGALLWVRKPSQSQAPDYALIVVAAPNMHHDLFHRQRVASVHSSSAVVGSSRLAIVAVDRPGSPSRYAPHIRRKLLSYIPTIHDETNRKRLLWSRIISRNLQAPAIISLLYFDQWGITL